ncbi:MAG TPA: Gfo/Idh/MocA family oxidoreductase [Chloroflexota bacterium]|nr:Gfo/Idh/MocA family oxidoreductase [Chloroflexota bacterium]
MANLRAGVVGGGVGASHAFAYARHPATDLVAVCDVNPAAFPRFYARAGLAPGSLREYTDYRQMLEAERLDLVSVATPDDYHVGPVVAAAELGAKGVLCEKPVATSLADADRIVAVSERIPVLVDHTRNSEPYYVEARRRVRDGALGRLSRIYAYSGGKRAMLFRNTTHQLGGVCFFAESDPVWVIAAFDQGFEDYGTVYKGHGGKDPALDPGATLIVEFANGVRALVSASKGTPPGPRLDLMGTRGRIVVGERATEAWQSAEDEGELQPLPVTWAQGHAGADLGERLIPGVDHLIRMVREGEPSNSSPRAARNVLEIILGACRSQAQGMVPVKLPLPRS